jgi:enterochelin esterase-like enzyme
VLPKTPSEPGSSASNGAPARRGLSRRALLGASLALGCQRAERTSAPIAVTSVVAPVASAPRPKRLPAEELTWNFPSTGAGRMSVVVVLPERSPEQRFPVLIAMHGRGETLKGAVRGARGWVDDYAVRRVIDRLHHPPLTLHDFQSFVANDRLARFNEVLVAERFEGLVLVCPYTPDLLRGDEPFSGAPPLASFLVDTLMPKIYAETPAIGTPATTGVDGVSLGGRAAISVGLLRPEAFGAVATLQAALDPRNASEIVARAKQAREKNPKLRLRFVTSSGDYYLSALRTITTALRSSDVSHEFLVVPGPHDYAFNRGPGAIEMLAYHDRVLRGREPI